MKPRRVADSHAHREVVAASHHVFAFCGHHPVVTLVVLVLAWWWSRHVRRHREAGEPWTVSFRGPWHTYISRRF